MTLSLEGWPTKANEAPSPHEVSLTLLDTNSVFRCLGNNENDLMIIIIIELIIMITMKILIVIVIAIAEIKVIKEKKGVIRTGE